MMSDREKLLAELEKSYDIFCPHETQKRFCLPMDLKEALIAALSEPEWIMINSLDDLPKKTEKFYQQIDCLVYHNGEIKHLVWNCEHGVWDREDGDDFYCNPLEPKAYIPFPSPPKGKTP